MGLDLAVYLVIGTQDVGAGALAPTVRAAVAGGASAVQLRDPRASARALTALAVGLRDVLAGTGVPLLVNDRLDVALAAGADGVHLGQSDLDVGQARRLAGPGFLIGLSVSRPDEVTAADALPPGTVDYLGIGPVFATRSKADAQPPTGLAGLAAMRAATDLPCVAIGGIDAGNARPVWATGVDGLAVVSAICAAPDPGAAAAHLRGARP